MAGAAELIKGARRRDGLTQAALAERLRISQAAFSKLERPDSNPTVATLERVLHACGHRLELRAYPDRSSVDDTLIAANLRRSPAQRLAAFESSYRSIKLIAEAGHRAAWPGFNGGEILRHLTVEGVDFVVVGGVAAVLHGAAQLTNDLDVYFSAEPASLAALARVLADLGAAGADVPDIARAERLRVQTSEGPLDLLRPESAPRYGRLRKSAEPKDVGGFKVLVASLDDLIAMKRAMGSPKDLVDLEELEAIARLRD